MKKITASALVLCGALIATQAHAIDMKPVKEVKDQGINWGSVPGAASMPFHASRGFVQPPNNLNQTLDNEYTAWQPRQFAIDQAATPEGRAQRLAVIGEMGAEPMRTAQVSDTTTLTQSSASRTTPSSDQGMAYSEESSNEPSSQSMETSSSEEVASTDQDTSKGTSQDMAMTSTRGSQTSQDKQQLSDQTKAMIGSHAILMQSSLHSALDQVRGMKGELKLSQNQPGISQQSMKSYNTFLREIRNDMKVAQSQHGMLKSQASKYPNLAQSDDFRAIDPAFHDVRQSLSQFESKASSRQYWSNQEQTRADLDRLEKQINTALDKTRSFSSDKLNASIG